MENDVQTVVQRLQSLRERQEAVNAAIINARDEVARCHRGISDARIAAVMAPEANPPKATEALVKRLDAALKTAEVELARLAPEADAISGAITQIETTIAPKLHAAALEKQAEIREEYRGIARRLLEAVDLVSTLTQQAKSKYDAAVAEYPADQQCPGQAPLLRYAGLAPIWDSAFINQGNGTRRDVAVNAVWQWDRTLVNPEDNVARFNRHQEEQRRQMSEQAERDRLARVNPPEPPKPQPEPERPELAHLTRTEKALCGEWIDPSMTRVKVPRQTA